MKGSLGTRSASSPSFHAQAHAAKARGRDNNPGGAGQPSVAYDAHRDGVKLLLWPYLTTFLLIEALTQIHSIVVDGHIYPRRLEEYWIHLSITLTVATVLQMVPSVVLAGLLWNGERTRVAEGLVRASASLGAMGVVFAVMAIAITGGLGVFGN